MCTGIREQHLCSGKNVDNSLPIKSTTNAYEDIAENVCATTEEHIAFATAEARVTATTAMAHTVAVTAKFRTDVSIAEALAVCATADASIAAATATTDACISAATAIAEAGIAATTVIATDCGGCSIVLCIYFLKFSTLQWYR